MVSEGGGESANDAEKGDDEPDDDEILFAKDSDATETCTGWCCPTKHVFTVSSRLRKSF